MAGSKVSAILMAAGLSRRMEGRDKLLLPYRGRTLLEHAVALLAALPIHERLLVITPGRLTAITLPPGVTPVLNHNPEAGQSESLRLGVGAATGGRYLFLPADQPLLDAATVTHLLAQGDGDRIVYPTVDGRPRSPCVFPARFRDELLAQRGDTGGRAVRAAHPDACLPLEMFNPILFQDIDSWADYQWLINN